MADRHWSWPTRSSIIHWTNPDLPLSGLSCSACVYARTFRNNGRLLTCANAHYTIGRFGRQLLALMRKNMLMLTRNRLSTALRFCACLIFMILMKMVIVTIDVANDNKEFARNMPHPVEEPIRGISACRSQGCKAFVYTPAPRDQFVPSGQVQDSDFAEGVGDSDAIRTIDTTQIVDTGFVLTSNFHKFFQKLYWMDIPSRNHT